MTVWERVRKGDTRSSDPPFGQGTVRRASLLLAQPNLDAHALTDFCRKHVLHGTPFVFNGKDDDFFEFRSRIARNFKVGFHEVFVVGSAKLGFSPHKRKDFGFDSDVDVAIVSRDLFEHIMEDIRVFQMDLRRSRRAVTDRDLRMYHDFLEYVPLGWIRPDKLPLLFHLTRLKNDWFEFFQSISYGNSEVGDYKVTAAVFCSYLHLEHYTLSGLRDVHSKITLER